MLIAGLLPSGLAPGVSGQRNRINQRLLRKYAGFSLLEMAVVLAIVGLLMAGLLPSLSGQIEVQRIRDTQKAIATIKDALIGFAQVNGRLPCPASPTAGSGLESFCTTASGGCTVTTTVQSHGRCANFYNGFVPAATLGLTPVDAQGYMLDSWNNRFRYAVSNTTAGGISNPFTSTNGMKNATIASLGGANFLYVCATATGVTTTNCGTATPLTTQAPAVVYSTGKNGGYGGTGTDETENPNINSTDNDVVFISHDPAPSSATNGEFDDIVDWISLGVLTNRMVSAGQLP